MFEPQQAAVPVVRTAQVVSCDAATVDEVASSIAVHEIRDAVNNNRDLIDRYRVDHPGVQVYEILQVLEHAVQAACGAVHARGPALTDWAETAALVTALTLLLMTAR